MYNEHGWATDWCMGDDVQTGGGDLPKDHNNQLMMCHMPCSLHMWLLLHRGFKGVFTLPKEVYSVFASFYAYTHMDAEITSPVYFQSAACPCPFTSSVERPPAYVTNPLMQNMYGST